MLFYRLAPQLQAGREQAPQPVTDWNVVHPAAVTSEDLRPVADWNADHPAAVTSEDHAGPADRL